MQMCPFCDKVYDESEYSRCPYCSGELDDDEEVRPCPEFPDSYLFEPTFYQGFVEFSKVSAGRTRKGNKNYLTFIKSSKIFGKIIFCKKIAQD